jgi:hypothetical protein
MGPAAAPRRVRGPHMLARSVTPVVAAGGRAPLLERSGELTAVDELLAATAAGHGALLLVVGPAGFGKTRLLGATRERAGEGGVTVLRARASELERDFSYGVVRQLFEPVVVAGDGAAAHELLSGAAALAAPLFDPTAPERALAAEASFAVLHGLFWLTANIAERRPVALVVDDLTAAILPRCAFSPT